MVNIEANKPFKNIGPGEFIKEELEVRNWRQEDLAKILGMSLKSINSSLAFSDSCLFSGELRYFLKYVFNFSGLGDKIYPHHGRVYRTKLEDDSVCSE